MMIIALGETKSTAAIPWLEWVIQHYSEIECEGVAAEALENIGTDEAMHSLISATLSTNAIGCDLEDIYYVLANNPRKIIPLLEKIIDENPFSRNKMISIITIGLEINEAEWEAAKPILARFKDR
jgi:hypothetical protein